MSRSRIVEGGVHCVHVYFLRPSSFLQPRPPRLNLLDSSTSRASDHTSWSRAVSTSPPILMSISRKSCRICSADAVSCSTSQNPDSPLTRTVSCLVPVFVSSRALPVWTYTKSTERQSSSFRAPSASVKATSFVETRSGEAQATNKPRRNRDPEIRRIWSTDSTRRIQ